MLKKIKKIFSETFKFWEVVILMFLACSVGILVGRFIINRNGMNISYQNYNSDLQEFIDNYNYIVNNYYGELDEKSLLENALQTILEEIDDPYATYFGATESSNFNIELTGGYYGAGIEIGKLQNTDQIVITKVFDDSPAQKAGIQVNDIIIKINDEPVVGISTSDLSAKIKSGGKKLKLSVLRDSSEMDISIELSQIVLKSVESEIINDDIGYISISIFANNTYGQVKEALNELQKEEIKSLIIDVRNNTGGYLSSVDKILSLFLDQTHVIYQIEDKNGIKKYYSTGKETVNYNIVILTNEFSASASEILTAALKEELHAVSIGKTTYGKGSAQKLHTMSDGTQYKFTTQKWLTPSGNSIDKLGVTVDLEVSLSDGYYENPILENDDQFQAALTFLNNN